MQEFFKVEDKFAGDLSISNTADNHHIVTHCIHFARLSHIRHGQGDNMLYRSFQPNKLARDEVQNSKMVHQKRRGLLVTSSTASRSTTRFTPAATSSSRFYLFMILLQSHQKSHPVTGRSPGRIPYVTGCSLASRLAILSENAVEVTTTGQDADVIPLVRNVWSGWDRGVAGGAANPRLPGCKAGFMLLSLRKIKIPKADQICYAP